MGLGSLCGLSRTVRTGVVWGVVKTNAEINKGYSPLASEVNSEKKTINYS